jgi:hypothetical protein
MSGDVIKEFLVGLGFDVDDSSLAKFNKAIGDASVKVAALFTAVQAMAAGVFYSIAKVAEGFEEMGYAFHIISPAINKALVLRRELLRAYSAAGVNITDAVLGAVKFNMALTKTQYALKAIYSSVAVKFFPLLTKQLDQFRNNLYSNLPKIQAWLERFIKATFKAFDATVQLGSRIWSILGRVYDFFVKLDQATDGWSTIILGVVAAWKLLNLSFLATPLGLLLTGLAGLLALYDDFKTYEEGGKSLFNWGPLVPTLKEVGLLLDGVLALVVAIFKAMNDIIHLRFDSLSADLMKIAGAFQSINNAIDGIVRSLGISWVNKILDARDKIDDSVLSFFNGSNGNAAQNIQAAPGTGVLRQPLGTSNVNNANTNQNVNQQTNINVMGSADALGTAQAVTSQQYNVNRDMVRNLKSATAPAGISR